MLRSIRLSGFTSLIIRLGAIMPFLLLSSPAWSQTAIIDNWPGGHCKAANVNQAAFLSWSQFGVRNPAPLGGPSFFVLCNLGPIEQQKRVNPTDIEVGVHYESAGATPVTCTFRDINADADPNVIQNIATYTVHPTFPPAEGGFFINCAGGLPCDGYRQIDDQPVSTSAWNTQTLVCALFPQTGINYITKEYNQF